MLVSEMEAQRIQNRHRRRMAHFLYHAQLYEYLFDTLPDGDPITVEPDPSGEGVSADGFSGIIIHQLALPDQADIGLDGLSGVIVHQLAVPEQIDIGLDGFRGIVIHQLAYP